MKLSRKFLNDYLDINDIETKKLAEDMTNIGNEYATCGKLIAATNLVIGNVLTCKMHPNSDHLHICTVDIGNEVLNIVCGAPNVHENMKVIVAKVGAKLPGGEIKEGLIRGEKSCGMLCSIEELGLEHKFLKKEDIDGICELGSDAKVGDNPLSYLNLDDEVIDFELTSNRGDLLSIMGMSYEIGALYNRPVHDIIVDYSKEKGKMNFNLKINTPKCSLFLARKALHVEIKDSPDFIQKRLIASGIRPINNVVDISNYVMLETGQPLHFYDADSLGDTLIVRDSMKNEKLTTLDNIERTLDENDIVIANNNEAIGLAGVMGGLSTEVTSNTQNILIEAAIFDSVSVRLTSKKILRSEASLRFEKGLDPNRTYLAMERSCYLLKKYANAAIIDDICTYDITNKDDKKIIIDINDINNLLGINISKEEILNIFTRLGFSYEENDKIIVSVPSRRLDISIKEDLIEEVARIYGIDRILGRTPCLNVKRGGYNKFLRLIRERLSSLGLNETLSYTLIPESEVHKYTNDFFEVIKLLDPMSDDKNALRYSIIPSLKMIYDYNIKRQNKDIFLFEIGKGFKKENNIYKEERHLGILLSGTYSDDLQKEKVSFYHLKGIMEELLDTLGFKNRYHLTIDNLPKEYHPGSSASIYIDNTFIGYIGKIHPQETKGDIFILEINLDIVENIIPKKINYQEISKYPTVTKDLAFIVNNDVTCETLIKEIKKSDSKYLQNVTLFDLYVMNNNKKSLAFNLVFSDKDSTLTDDIINPILEKIIFNVEKNLKAELRDK